MSDHAEYKGFYLPNKELGDKVSQLKFKLMSKDFCLGNVVSKRGVNCIPIRCDNCLLYSGTSRILLVEYLAKHGYMSNAEALTFTLDNKN